MTLQGRRVGGVAVLLLAPLLGCQREGPIFDDTTTPTATVPLTPVAPIPAAPRPSPTPTPDLPEDPPSGGTPGDDIPDNTNPVARVEARIYFIECGGVAVPGVEAPVGCRIHLDVTAKDQQGKPTRAKGGPQWTFSNPGIISVSSEADYTPTLTALAPGAVTAACTIDGVTSPPFTILLK